MKDIKLLRQNIVLIAGYLGGDREAWKHYDATELIKAGHRHPNTILIDPVFHFHQDIFPIPGFNAADIAKPNNDNLLRGIDIHILSEMSRSEIVAAILRCQPPLILIIPDTAVRCIDLRRSFHPAFRNDLLPVPIAMVQI